MNGLRWSDDAELLAVLAEALSAARLQVIHADPAVPRPLTFGSPRSTERSEVTSPAQHRAKRGHQPAPGGRKVQPS